MTDTSARTIPRHADRTTAPAPSGAAAPLPAPQYAGLFIEPDLPPFADDTE
ncbi:hypothetical protein ABZ172_12335 [Streptomyces sp. NPDC006296]|uniref:hypothetical protein n=1 Tax=Streptomyces sp. NPDC006296 TaxID=3156746 RepID=UPI0033AD9CBE